MEGKERVHTICRGRGEHKGKAHVELPQPRVSNPFLVRVVAVCFVDLVARLEG